MSRIFLALTLFFLSGAAQAQVNPDLAEPSNPPTSIVGPMTPERLLTILVALDEEAGPRAGGIGLTIADIPVVVFLDPVANRMRAVVPVASADALTQDDMLRVLQANFDTALDARYAIANGRLWSTYIHPLAELQTRQLISGLAQTVTLAQTYGTAYTSGTMTFGAGDSAERFRDLMEDLMERGEEL